MKYLLTVFVFSSLIIDSIAQRIIPQPLLLESKNAAIDLPDLTGVYAEKVLKPEADYLVKVLGDDFGAHSTTNKSKTSYIKLLIDVSKKADLGLEGYELTVNNNGIVIIGADRSGVFYGIQSLRQLIHKKETGAGLTVAAVYVKDKPRFGWRSFMLDEGRYFKGAPAVKVLLDEMASLKMNIFQWHLTEDQGWRLAINKYPLLAKTGGKRDSTQIGDWNSKIYDGKSHEGFYSKDEIREIIRYAASLHIKIVPEIEMPGHSSAAIAAYPWLGVTKKPISVPTSFGVKYDIFDVTDPKVITFLHDVLNEVIALFPSDVIHIGGDEVKYDQWMASPTVQAYMKAHNLTSPADLQIAFTNDISNFLSAKGKRMMGWNDILGAKLHEYNTEMPPASGKLSPKTIVQFWKGDPSLINDALRKGYDMVNSYHVYTYLDYDYKTIPLQKAYDFDPVPTDIEEKYQKQVLGLGTQMWGEWIPTDADMYRQTFPRIAAYAEVGWTAKSQKNYEQFVKQLDVFKKHWQQKGITVGE